MIQALRNAIVLPDLRRKLFYTLLILIIYRLVAHVPVPGAQPEVLERFLQQATGAGQLFNVLNMLSGGAVQRLSVMATGVQSYITAQLIVQLLQPIIPALERLAQEGEAGQRKINQIVHYATIPLSLVQSYGWIMGLNLSMGQQGGPEALPGFGFGAGKDNLLTVAVLFAMTAGTMFAIWLGELISEQGIGNGLSLIIFGGIVAGMPARIQQVWVQAAYGADGMPNTTDDAWWMGALLLAIFLLLMAVTVFVIVVVNEGQRRIPVQYGKRVRGFKTYSMQAQHIPLRVNSAGMIPLIFAQAILTFPAIIANFLIANESVGDFAQGVVEFFSPGQSPWYIPLYFFAVVGATYFYTDVMIQQQDLPGSLKRQGGFIPGIRPGRPTGDFINAVYRRITLVGAVFLGVVAVLPLVVSVILDATLGIQSGGTGLLLITASGLLIVVGTVIDTMRQLEAQLLMRHYEGFMK